MNDIDKILEDVKRWTGKCEIASGDVLTLTFRVRCMGVDLFGATDKNGLVPRGALALERAFRHAPILASEVLRLRAELANVERALKESTGRTVLCRSRLVAAAVDLAHEVEGSGPPYEREIAYAYRITGILLKFEDGRFAEDMQC